MRTELLVAAAVLLVLLASLLQFSGKTPGRARRAAAAVLLALAVGLCVFLVWQRWF
jgi:hypothetical protein